MSLIVRDKNFYKTVLAIAVPIGTAEYGNIGGWHAGYDHAGTTG